MKTISRDRMKILRRGMRSFGPNREKVAAYIAALQNPDGGFRGRMSQSDLYYTVFAEEILLAVGADFNKADLICYLHTIEPQRLDLIHLCCWIQCASGMNILERQLKVSLIERLNAFRCKDGLFHHVLAGQNGSVYGTFMVLSAAMDLGERMLESAQVISKLAGFRNLDGSYRNEYAEGAGMIPATAASMVIQSHLGVPTEQETVNWILSCLTEEGGFAVSPMMTIADLLSTATVLQALHRAGVDLMVMKEKCGSFVLSLFQDIGGFCANSFDSTVDAEYTFYGLLAMGNLYE